MDKIFDSIEGGLEHLVHGVSTESWLVAGALVVLAWWVWQTVRYLRGAK